MILPSVGALGLANCLFLLQLPHKHTVEPQQINPLLLLAVKETFKVEGTARPTKASWSKS